MELLCKEKGISCTATPQPSQDSCHLNCRSTELPDQATGALLFGRSSDFSTITLLSSLPHLTLLMMASVLNFSFLLCSLLSQPRE